MDDETIFKLILTVIADRTESHHFGDGYGHLSVSVADLGAERAWPTKARVESRGVVEPAPADELVGRFFFIADADGYQTEVLARSSPFE